MNSRKILVTDDSSLNRGLLSDILRSSFLVEEASDGLQAIDVLSQRSSEFSAVLLDINMPGANGFQVLEFMKERDLSREVPVIIISSESSPEVIGKAYELGAIDYIDRPYNAYVVERRVKNIIALSERHRQNAEIIAEEIFERTKVSNIMVSLLSQVVGACNYESGTHIVHIRLLTQILLDALLERTDRYDIATDQVPMIALASALHDIGKVVIPDDILNKQGNLDEAEFELMKTHAARGASMIADMGFDAEESLIKYAYDICRWHHERFDGGGYPDGLVGDVIPIAAQVVSIADVYDALTSARCYKDSFSHDEAVSMILGGDCGQFNPLLLDVVKDLDRRLEPMLEKFDAESYEESALRLFTDEVLRRHELDEPLHFLGRLSEESLDAPPPSL